MAVDIDRMVQHLMEGKPVTSELVTEIKAAKAALEALEAEPRLTMVFRRLAVKFQIWKLDAPLDHVDAVQDVMDDVDQKLARDTQVAQAAILADSLTSGVCSYCLLQLPC